MNFKITQVFRKLNQTELTQVIRFRPVNYEQVVAEFRYVKSNSIGGNSYLKIVKKHLSVFVKFVAKDINTCIEKTEFPDKLKMADIKPALKWVKNTTNQTSDQ